MLASVLVANRGEIAVRIIRTLRRLGIRAIAVYSDVDAHAAHVGLADAAFALGPPPGYLDVERIVDAVRRSGAQALHPGYGFLAESAQLARACPVTWIGPPPQALELLADKAAAKRLAAQLAIPTVPGIEGDDARIAAWAEGRLPIIVKAAAGGGGRGMRTVRALADLEPALRSARREVGAAFGDDALLAERFVDPARHVEVQFLADAHGAALHLGERECSLQRRHQKLVEECPSPAVSPELRARMGEAAIALARAAGYVGAGTCEFLLDGEDFYFLEVNARLQVEHPVTELVYGLDIVEAQLRIAAGEPLRDAPAPRGHAVEARVCAEDAERGFLPGAGRIVAYREPEHGEVWRKTLGMRDEAAAPARVRVDSGVCEGAEVTTHYDSLLCKVIAGGDTRAEALDRLDRALADLVILGPPTNAAFVRRLLADEAVRAGRLDTGLVERMAPAPAPAGDDARAAIVAALHRTLEHPPGDDPWDALAGWRIDGPAPQRRRLVGERGGAVALTFHGGEVIVDGGAPQRFDAEPHAGGLAVTLDGERRVWACARDGDLVRVGIDGRQWAFREEPLALRRDLRERAATLEAPMPGTVLDVRVRDGDAVEAGDVVVVLESMKMELEVVAPAAGTVERLAVSPGDRVRGGQVLAAVEAATGAEHETAVDGEAQVA